MIPQETVGIEKARRETFNKRSIDDETQTSTERRWNPWTEPLRASFWQARPSFLFLSRCEPEVALDC